jgi:hypothetical protein
MAEATSREARGAKRPHPAVGCLAAAALVFATVTSCERTDLTGGPNLSRGEEQISCPAPPQATELKVRINEMVLDNQGSLQDEFGEFPQWIELFNPTGESVNMGKTTFSDSLVNSAKWVFPCIPEAVMEPGGFLILFLDGDTDNPDDFHVNFTLDLSGGPVTLFLNGGAQILTISPADVKPDLALGSYPDGQGDLGPLAAPTPGAPNAEPDVPIEVVINEVMLDNQTAVDDGTGAFPAWLELYNPSPAAANLAGIPLSDDPADPAKWLIPDVPAARLASGGFLVVYLDGDTENPDDFHANFVPDISSTVTLLLDTNGDRVTIEPTEVEPDLALGRYPDGERGGLLPLVEATAGGPNAEPVAPPQASFRRGDVNADDRVNIADAIFLLQYLFKGGEAPPCLSAADIADNGRLNVSDANLLLRHVSGVLPTLPDPFNACGQDPTEDELGCETFPPCE